MNSGRVLRTFGMMIFSVVVVATLSMPYQAYAVNEDYNRVARRGTPVVDGNLSDSVWQGADWQEMGVYGGGDRPEGFSAKSALLWDDEFLYIAIEVDDQIHASPKALVTGSNNLWRGDSPQHRVDLEYDSESNSAQDIEWGYALQDGEILTNAWSSADNIDFAAVEIVRDDAKKETYYEVALVLRLHDPQQTLSEYVKANPDAKIGYSDMVNDNDGGDRLGWLEWSSGIGSGKDANLFGTLTFGATTAVSAAERIASTWGELKRSR